MAKEQATYVEDKPKNFHETIRTLIVFIIILSCILYFFHGTVMKWTFLTFFVGLAPFVIAAIWRDTHPKTLPSIESNYDPMFDDSYLPGVRNFDGTYMDSEGDKQ